MARPHAKSTSYLPSASAIPDSLEAKLVILGSQGVGKTSLINRFMSPPAPPHSHPSLSSSSAATALPAPQSTIGASFYTKRVLDPATSTTVRLQIWDTAGQERFRSISRLYYRGASAGLLCYDITNEASWEEMKGWLRELKAQCGGGEGPVIHVVGNKSDIVTDDPSRREVPFERTIAYVAEQLYPSRASTPPATAMPATNTEYLSTSAGAMTLPAPNSKRSSGFWGQDVGWDSCHEVNARDGEGIEEVFRVIAGKLVEQRNRRLEQEEAGSSSHAHPHDSHRRQSMRPDGVSSEYFSFPSTTNGNGSFRIGRTGDGKRKSWLGLPAGLSIAETGEQVYEPQESARRKGKCC